MKGKLTSLATLLESSHLAFYAASLSRWSAI